MKKSLPLVIALLIACLLQAQEYEYPALKQVLKGNYDAAIKDIDKHLAKDPADVPYLYSAAKLYSLDEYSGRDIPKAYKYINDCKSKFLRLEPSAQDKLIAKGLTKELLNTTIHEVCALALKDAEALDTAYPRAVPSLQRQAKEHLSHLAFLEAEKRNTVGSFEFFIEQNPNGSDVKEAIRRRNMLAYELAKKQNTLTAYRTFIDQYPEAENVPDAWQQIYSIALFDAMRVGTEEALNTYIGTYPDSPYAQQQLAKQAADKYEALIKAGDWTTLKEKAGKRKDSMEQRRMYYAILQIARNKQSTPAALFAYQNAPCEDIRDAAWTLLHDIYCSTGVVADITKFHEQYPNPRFADLEAHDKKIVQQYNNRYGLAGTHQTGSPLPRSIRVDAFTHIRLHYSSRPRDGATNGTSLCRCVWRQFGL